jgi:hypothetical protein
MKSAMELHEHAVNAANSLRESKRELLELYRELAKEEGIDLLVDEEKLPQVEFNVRLSSGVVLLLRDARKQLGLSTGQLSLSDVIERHLATKSK